MSSPSRASGAVASASKTCLLAWLLRHLPRMAVGVRDTVFLIYSAASDPRPGPPSPPPTLSR